MYLAMSALHRLRRCPLSQRFHLSDINLPINSAIGRKFRDRPCAAVLLASITVTLDFALVHQYVGDVRACVAIVAFALAVYLSDGDLKSLGLRASPVQGWLPWICTTLKIGGIVAVCIVAGLGAWVAMGHSLNLHLTNPSSAWSRSVQMCFVAPVLEEVVYRVSACGLIAAIIGNRQTIAINGVLFGLLHVWYGNPSPENLVGGFFLAWSYLKSETILVPFLLHSGGNLLALAFQIAGWYTLGGTG